MIHKKTLSTQYWFAMRYAFIKINDLRGYITE
jgi:hypothetical protein